jgi:hypothetical protein
VTALLARAASALPDAALGVMFLVTWLDPRVFGGGLLRYALLTMLMEFFVVHSSGFMSLVLWGTSLDAVKKTLATVALGAAYSVLLVGFALAIGAWWPVWAFWGLTFNRLTSALFGPKAAGKARARIANEWATSAALYLLWVFAGTLLWVPPLGITPEVVASAGVPGQGPWAEQPYRVVVAGAGYFFCQAWLELGGNAFIKVKHS